MSTAFVFAVNVCSLPGVILICSSEFYFLALNFILPWQLWATVGYQTKNTSKESFSSVFSDSSYTLHADSRDLSRFCFFSLVLCNVLGICRGIQVDKLASLPLSRGKFATLF